MASQNVSHCIKTTARPHEPPVESLPTFATNANGLTRRSWRRMPFLVLACNFNQRRSEPSRQNRLPFEWAASNSSYRSGGNQNSGRPHRYGIAHTTGHTAAVCYRGKSLRIHRHPRPYFRSSGYPNFSQKEGTALLRSSPKAHGALSEKSSRTFCCPASPSARRSAS